MNSVSDAHWQIGRQICPHGISFEEIWECTQSDSTFPTVFWFLDTHWPHKSQVMLAARPYYQLHDELSVSGGVLLRDGCIVIPSTLQPKLLHMAHAGIAVMVWMKRHTGNAYPWIPYHDTHGSLTTIPMDTPWGDHGYEQGDHGYEQGDTYPISHTCGHPNGVTMGMSRVTTGMNRVTCSPSAIPVDTPMG